MQSGLNALAMTVEDGRPGHDARAFHRLFHLRVMYQRGPMRTVSISISNSTAPRNPRRTEIVIGDWADPLPTGRA